MQCDTKRSGVKGVIGLTDHRLLVVLKAANVEASPIVISAESQFVYLFGLEMQRRSHQEKHALRNMYMVLHVSRQCACN